MAQGFGEFSKKDLHRQSSFERSEEYATNTKGAAYKSKTAWTPLISLCLYHLFCIPGIYLALTEAKWQTNLIAFLLYWAGMIGVCGGAHRLWSHRSYKVKWQLNALLLTFYTLTFQGTAWSWARDHRVHHKFQETDADPYSAARGLWFSHIGWLLQTKHPEVTRRGKGIDMSDLVADPLVMFQKRYYYQLVFLISFFLPTVLPVFCWGERWLVAFLVAVVVRTVLTYHCTWTINSLAHVYGNRPYEKSQTAAQNRLVSLLTLGEGWHNYHHTFPWDYAAAEVGWGFNLTRAFVDAFAAVGWAYDRKTVGDEAVRRRVLRTGDGTHPHSHRHPDADGEQGVTPSWGWGDPTMAAEERDMAAVVDTRRL